MKLLNLGCGYNRLPDPFVNIDSLKSQFKKGSPERQQLDDTPNYVEADLRKGIPFPDNSINGILASHFMEHLDCQEAAKMMKECYRVLMPHGIMVASVPDTSYFRKVHSEDTKENSGRLFGEQMDEGNPEKSFFDCALFFNEHKQVLTEDSLWALFTRGGFEHILASPPDHSDVANRLKIRLNRPLFSLVMWAIK